MENQSIIKLNYDCIEYYVGMAKMVVYWHVKALGFEVAAYCGPETGVPEKVSYFLKKNNIKLVITAASQPSSHEIVSFVDMHGNSIKRIAIEVDDIKEFYKKALEEGAIPISSPTKLEDDKGFVECAAIKIFDDNEICLVNYDHYNGEFMPGYEPFNESWGEKSEDSHLNYIDHIACALRENEVDVWEPYLNKIFSLNTVQEFGKGNISTNKSGLSLKVLQSQNKKINNVLVEPDNKEKKSQVQIFIDENYGTGIQHVAFCSGNIFESIKMLKKKGVQFTSYPDSYYDLLKQKYPNLPVDIKRLKEHGVLCDVIDDAILLQTFTKPIGDRPTFFYEIVQRVNQYQGFGLGNINTLFEAVESEMSNLKN